MLKSLVIFLLFVFSTGLYAQKAVHYDINNGLPSNHIYRITQDNKGFIWILTDNGIVKYDGVHFKTFTTKDGLPVNDIWDLRITPDGKVWFFTRARELGYIFDDSVQTFKNIDSTVVLNPWVIFRDGNKIAFSDAKYYYELVSHNGIKKWTSNPKLHHKWTQIFKPNQPRLPIVTKPYKRIDDSIFYEIGIERYAVTNLKTKHTDTYRYIDFGIQLQYDDNMIRMSQVNKQLQLFGLGFSATLAQDMTLKKVDTLSQNYKAHINIIDKSGNRWLGTVADGIYFFPHQQIKTKYHLVDQKINHLKHLNGRIFASVFHEGCYQFVDSINTFTKLFDPGDVVYNIVHIKALGKTVFLSNKGIHVQAGNQSIKTYIEPSAMPKRDLIFFNDTLFGFSTTHFEAIDTSYWRSIRKIDHTGIKGFVLFKGRLIMATLNGLKEYKNGRIVPLSFKNVNFDKPAIHLSIFDDQLIVSTNGFGAYQTDLQKIILIPETSYLSITNDYIIDNQLWMASNKGLLKFQSNPNDLPKFMNSYTQDDGLLSNYPRAVVVKNNQLWVADNQGISISPLQLTTKNEILNIYFRKINFNAQKVTANIEFDYTPDNQLEIQIASIDFSKYSNQQWKYKLLPITPNWTNVNTAELTFNHLQPNSYTLIVASNGLTKSMSFTIAPLWYQILWIKMLFMIVGISLLVFTGYRYNLHLLAQQENKLSVQRKTIEQELYALRSQMNPHFVFNSLNAIQSYMACNELDLSEKYLIQFSKLIRMFFNFSRKQETTLHEEIDLLKTYLAVEKMRFEDQLNYRFDIDPDLDNHHQLIPTMLLQPIVENAVNHGIFHKTTAGHLVIDFRKIDRKTFSVTIADDGIGLIASRKLYSKKKEKQPFRSSEILEERIELLNQSKNWYITREVIDQQKNGTTICLIFSNLQPKILAKFSKKEIKILSHVN